MLYRVRLDAAFPNQTDAESFMTYARIFIAKANSVNEGKDNAEVSFVDFELCYHDETPNRPCEQIERKEVRAGKVVNIKVVKAVEL